MGLFRCIWGEGNSVFSGRERRESSSLQGSAGAAAWKTTERVAETFAPVNHAAILLDHKGNIRTITGQARQWLGSYFNSTPSGKTLPPKLGAWVEQQMA